MEINDENLELLFESVCDRARTSFTQSSESIVRLSRQRLSQGKADAASTCVLAAASLCKKDAQGSMDMLNRGTEHIEADADSNRLAGYASLLLEQPLHAKHYLDRAVHLDPHLSDCWNLLGQLAETMEDAKQATQYYERGMVFEQSQHSSAIALAKLQLRNGNLSDAIHTLRVCLFRDRRSAELNVTLAGLLQRRASVLGRMRRKKAQQRIRYEALSCLQIANASMPSARTLIMQGRLQQSLHLYEEAKKSFQLAVERNPTSFIALTQLAAANVDCGEIDDATKRFEDAIALDPCHGETHFQYTRAKKFSESKKTRSYITLLRNQISNKNHRAAKQIKLCFALAKVLDDVGQHDEAWEMFDRGNRLKRDHSQCIGENASKPRRPPFDFSRMLDQTVNFFTAEFFQNNGLGNPSKKPIFIVGMPRSGTTMTEQILTSHPQIAGAGELDFISQIRQEIVWTQNRHAKNTNAEPRSYPDAIADTPRGLLRGYANEYLSRLETFANDELRITDKMPTNFVHLGLIGLLFPGATIIHCRRNPMDVMVSCYCQNLNAPFCDLDQLVAYHRSYRLMMKHFETVLPLQIHNVDYEAMVSNPQRETRSLIERCGLTWNDACLDFHANRRAVHTPSKWQVRQPMYKSSVEKWRRFEKYLAPIAQQIEAEVLAESIVQPT